MQNLRDVQDMAAQHGLSDSQEARFPARDLGAEQTGVNYLIVKPGQREAFAHRHRTAEEVYVVIAGSGGVKLDDELVELTVLDAVRVSPGVTRASKRARTVSRYLSSDRTWRTMPWWSTTSGTSSRATSMSSEPTPETTDNPAQPSDAASVERNKAVSRRWIEVFNERDDAAEADVRAQDYVAYAPVSLEPAPLDSEAWTRFLSGFVEAFPDLRLTVEDAVGEGDLVAQRIHFAGTHTGEFQGLPPTNRKVEFSGLELNRFVDGRVVEHWFQMDSLTLLQQLGLVVVPGPRLLPRVLAHQVKKLRRSRDSS